MRQEQVNIAIKTFCSKFIENPYLHRCEHSLHISLYNELITLCPKNFILNNDGTFLTNYIHKEFPGRKQTDTSTNDLVDRTQIDLVILAENQQTDSINDFLNGNFDIDYSFELALEYGIEHLCWDIFKFITGSNKSVNHNNYIIHLYNKIRSKKYFDKVKIDIMLSDNTTDIDLNNKFELCYYLIYLCINYSRNKEHKDYEEILAIVIGFVSKKNKKYNDKYLLEPKEVQIILQKMKFIFIDANPQTMIEPLMNI